MTDSLIIKIKNKSSFELIKTLFNHNINIEIIDEDKKYITCKIEKKDLKDIKKLYKVEVIKEYSFKRVIVDLKRKVYVLILMIISVSLFLFLSNVIVKINILSNNKDLVKELIKDLDENNIKRLSLKKNFIELARIKKNILEKYKNKLEWLEIENVGMTYIIKLEERKSKNIDQSEGNCNIVATTDGVISKIISTNGVVLVKNNQVVKEGDLLITGQIMLNEETKENICARGLVFAEKWYNVTIDIPDTYKVKKYTNKVRYNLLYSPDNRDYKIFKSRLKNYDSDKKEIISILGQKLYLVKEYEYINEEIKLDDDTLNKRIDDLIVEKLELSLKDNERILDKNILKKEVNDSRIKIELFVTIERLISKQVTYTLE